MERLTQITSDPISIEDVYHYLDDPECGAAVVFVGRVRCQNGGRPVQQIRYSAYGDMVRREGNKILDEAASLYPLRRAILSHFVGTLLVGGVSVVVGVASPHRRASFDAASWIMDELKKRLPVWKEELYVEGDREWPHNVP